jgi:hypothetical protein
VVKSRSRLPSSFSRVTVEAAALVTISRMTANSTITAPSRKLRV